MGLTKTVKMGFIEVRAIMWNFGQTWASRRSSWRWSRRQNTGPRFWAPPRPRTRAPGLVRRSSGPCRSTACSCRTCTSRCTQKTGSIPREIPTFDFRFILHLSLLPALLKLVFRPLCEDLIEAWQSSGLDYWSLIWLLPTHRSEELRTMRADLRL